MRAQPPRSSSTVSGSPASTWVTCSDASSGSARTAVTSALQTRTLTPLSPSPRSGSDGDHVAEGRKARERLALQLPHPPPGQVELVAAPLSPPALAPEPQDA